jgi:hypothetical protein
MPGWQPPAAGTPVTKATAGSKHCGCYGALLYKLAMTAHGDLTRSNPCCCIRRFWRYRCMVRRCHQHRYNSTSGHTRRFVRLDTCLSTEFHPTDMHTPSDMDNYIACLATCAATRLLPQNNNSQPGLCSALHTWTDDSPKLLGGTNHTAGDYDEAAVNT